MEEKIINFSVLKKKIIESKLIIFVTFLVILTTAFFDDNKVFKNISHDSCEILTTIFIGMGVFYGASYVHKNVFEEKLKETAEKLEEKYENSTQQFLKKTEKLEENFRNLEKNYKKLSLD
jgi:hypothetical protein